jgi:cyanophycin synthetase
VDYAHNPHSYQALGDFVKNWTGERIGIVGGPGDRRDEDFVTLGKLSADIFDRIIIKEDEDLRNRPSGDGAKLIAQGIAESGKNTPYEIVLNETEAVNATLDSAPAGSLVVILPESVGRAISLIEARNPKADLGLTPMNGGDSNTEHRPVEIAHPVHNIPPAKNSPLPVVETEEAIAIPSNAYVQSSS